MLSGSECSKAKQSQLEKKATSTNTLDACRLKMMNSRSFIKKDNKFRNPKLAIFSAPHECRYDVKIQKIELSWSLKKCERTYSGFAADTTDQQQKKQN